MSTTILPPPTPLAERAGAMLDARQTTALARLGPRTARRILSLAAEVFDRTQVRVTVRR